MRFGKYYTGAGRRTLEVYSRIENVSLCVDSGTLGLIDPEFSPLLQKFKLVHSYSTSRSKYLYGFIKCLSEARKVDVILSYSEYSLSIVYSYLLSLFSGKPLVIFVHHVTEEMRGESKFYPLLRQAFKHADRIICLDNEEVYQELRSMFPKKKILTSTNAIDVNKYYTSEDKICDGLLVGDFGERKGVKYLKEIWERVLGKIPNAKLCILGRGWEGKDLPRNAEHLGYVSEAKKKEIFAKSKVFVFPSLYEGFSLVTAEALASSLPAVLWDLPWSKRFEKGVVKVKFDDVEGFANSIVTLLKDEELRRKLGEEGRSFITSRYSLDEVARKEYEELMEISQG
jgi:glycosyltransferase involved in cell wall biosynthesis